MSSWGGNRARRLRELTLSTYGNICHLCGMPGATTVDHVIPRHAGGSDALDNLRPAHLSCNSSRQDLPIGAWRKKFRAQPLDNQSRRW